MNCIKCLEDKKDFLFPENQMHDNAVCYRCIDAKIATEVEAKAKAKGMPRVSRISELSEVFKALINSPGLRCEGKANLYLLRLSELIQEIKREGV